MLKPKAHEFLIVCAEDVLSYFAGRHLWNLFLRAVFTRGRVDALISQPQSLDRVTIDQVRPHDLRNIRELYEPIPHGLWIHDDGNAVLALVKTARLVDADQTLQTMSLRCGLKGFPDCYRSFVGTTTFGVSGCALVLANEYMSLKRRH